MSQKFPSTLPMDITFFNAESVSPQKLNNIFSAIKSALFSFEMYLGNGIDFAVDQDKYKTGIVNIASVLGTAIGNVYMPYNFFGSLQTLHKRYFSQSIGSGSGLTSEHATYNNTTKSISIKELVNIPIQRTFYSDCTIGMHYIVYAPSAATSSASATVHAILSEGSGSTVQHNLITAQVPNEVKNNSSKNILAYTSIVVPAGSFISHIEFNNTNSSNVEFILYSLFYTDGDISDKQYVNESWSAATSAPLSIPYNNFYGIGLDHRNSLNEKSYFMVKQPCKWCNASYHAGGAGYCEKRTGNNICIGNTYDIYVDDGKPIEEKKGLPICGGTLGLTLNSTNIPASGKNYSTDYDGASPPTHMIVQSPLVIYKDKQHSLLYHPISLTSEPESTNLPTGTVYLYDTSPQLNNPVNLSLLFIASSRPDIVIVHGHNVADDAGKYILISSEVGVSQLSNAYMYIKAITTDRSISVYAD